MAGKKGKISSKTESKHARISQASGGQHNLFHFYKKQSKDKNAENVADIDNAEAVASTSSGASRAQPPEENIGTTPFKPLEPDKRQGLIAEMNLVLTSDVADHVGVQQDSRFIPPGLSCQASPPEEDIHIGTELTRTPLASSPQPHPSQTASAAVVHDNSASLNFVGRSPEPSVKPSRRILYPIFKKSRETSNLSRATADDTRPIDQLASSSKVFSRRKPPLKAKDEGAFPIVVDLTQSPEEDDATKSGPSKSTAPQNSIIVMDEDEVLPDSLPPGTQATPIDLSSSPPAQSRSKKALHPFFAQHPSKREGDDDSTPTPLLKNLASRQMEVPWPNAENQHCAGPQNFFRASDLAPFGKYRGNFSSTCFTTPHNLRFLENAGVTRSLFVDAQTTGVESHVPTPIEREAVLSSLPSAHREHPGITRLLSESPNIEPHSAVENEQTWSQKWRPRRAVEVLGNEGNALYLKAWLRALAICTDDKLQTAKADAKGKSPVRSDIRGTKRPTVVRAVAKKRGRKRRRLESDDDDSSLGDWMVGDEEEAVESGGGSDTEYHLHRPSFYAEGASVFPSSPAHRSGVVPDAYSSSIHNLRESHSSDFSTLTNTILLAGPSGSGKTSTVYACAEELGWEVFEVYPGIGKRSGGHISSLVGDVGKNHLVGRRGLSGAYTKCSFNQPFQPGFGYLAGEDENDAIGIEDGKRSIRQSIILLEEVDVLFKEDANFWPTVLNVIKSSHRPVCITCNDISLIPQDDLPLQTCLRFQPCPSPLAASFLQCVCLAEGRVVLRNQLENLYAETYTVISCDEPDEPSIPYPSQPRPCSDLRRVLNNSQFWCCHDITATDVENRNIAKRPEAPGIKIRPCTEIFADWSRAPDVIGGFPEETASQEYDLYHIGKHAECTSYVDSYLERRASDVLEALAIDRYGPSGDDEVGYTLLDKSPLSGHSSGHPFYGRDTDIAWEALVTSRHVLETSGAGPRVRGLRGGERGTTPLWESQSLIGGRVANQIQVVSFLDDLMTLFGPLLPRPAAVLEYTPYVRQMILADDAMEAGAAAENEGGLHRRRGRQTRNRWQMEYPRYISVSEEGREAARKTVLA